MVQLLSVAQEEVDRQEHEDKGRQRQVGPRQTPAGEEMMRRMLAHLDTWIQTAAAVPSPLRTPGVTSHAGAGPATQACSTEWTAERGSLPMEQHL